jgi:hypothetical protein
MGHEIDDPGAIYSIAYDMAAVEFHQIKNRAHSGLSALAHLSDELRASGFRRDLLHMVDRARECFEEITRHCTTLCHERGSEPEPLDMNAIVRSAVEMLGESLR